MREGVAVRWLGAVVAGCGLAAAAGVCSAQGSDPVVAPLARGPLVVWAVTAEAAAGPVDARQAAAAARAPLPVVVAPAAPGSWRTIHEQTAASYGQTAASVGQTAASYGQTAGSVGTPAAGYGENAGAYGQTAGSFGQTAGSVGQTAASYGTTVAEFGQTAGSYGVGLGEMNRPGEEMVKAAQAGPAVNVPVRGMAAFWEQELKQRLGEADAVRVVGIPGDKLGAELERTAGTAEAPDVLLGEPLPGVWWMGLAKKWGQEELARDRPMVFAEAQQGEMGIGEQAVELALLKAAAHPQQARAFAALVEDEQRCYQCGRRFAEGSPEAVAERAFAAMLGGGGLGGDADSQAAHADPRLAQSTIYRMAELPAGVRPRVDVMMSSHNARMAVVGLRAALTAQEAWGVVHGVAVLRADARGVWRVLAVASNVTPPSVEQMNGLMMSAGAGGARQKLAGIRQAAPFDGDNRPPQPDLWWDPGGGTVMQVVEWQRGNGSAWSNSQLQLVPDTGGRLRTRVRAEFAVNGTYRWRVWSVGPDGAMVISPWRRLNIVR